MQYGANENRNKTILKNNSNNQDIYTRYYFGDVEMQILHQENNKKQTIHYIAGLHGLASIAVKENNGSFNFFYPYTDHLGSILTVTDNQANIIAEQNFDAWGRERNTQTWALLPSGVVGGGLSWFYRGYTGHEHLPEFNIINMNGRLYDPLLARFLSPDNYIQSPFNTQSHNRYSYVWNNPLKYNDPSGEIAIAPLIIAATLISGMNMVLNPNVNSLGKAVGVTAISFASTFAGAYVGQAVTGAMAFGGFGSGFLAGASSGFTSGFISGAGSSWILGGSFTQGLISGVKVGGLSAGLGGFIGGMSNGIADAKKGYKFFTGKKVESITAKPKYEMPSIKGKFDNGCAPTTGAMIDQSYGGSLTEDDIAKWFTNDFNNEGIGDLYFWENFAEKTGSQLNFDVMSKDWAETIYNNWNFQIEMSNRYALSVNNNHSVALHSITKKAIYNYSGKLLNTKYILNAMDSSYGNIVNYNLRNTGNFFQIIRR